MPMVERHHRCAAARRSSPALPELPIVAISRDFLAFEDEFSTGDGTTRCWVTLLPLQLERRPGSIMSMPSSASRAASAAKPREAEAEVRLEDGVGRSRRRDEPVVEEARSGRAAEFRRSRTSPRRPKRQSPRNDRASRQSPKQEPGRMTAPAEEARASPSCSTTLAGFYGPRHQGRAGLPARLPSRRT